MKLNQKNYLLHSSPSLNEIKRLQCKIIEMKSSYDKLRNQYEISEKQIKQNQIDSESFCLTKQKVFIIYF